MKTYVPFNYFKCLTPINAIKNYKITYRNKLIGIADASVENFLSYILTNSFIFGDISAYSNKNQIRLVLNSGYIKNTLSYFGKFEESAFHTSIKVKKFNNFLALNKLFFPFFIDGRSLLCLNSFSIKKNLILKANFCSYSVLNNQVFVYISQKNAILNLKFLFTKKAIEITKYFKKVKKYKFFFKKTKKKLKKKLTYLKSFLNRVNYIYISPRKQTIIIKKKSYIFFFSLILIENLSVKKKIKNFSELLVKNNLIKLEIFPLISNNSKHFFKLTPLVTKKKRKFKFKSKKGVENVKIYHRLIYKHLNYDYELKSTSLIFFNKVNFFDFKLYSKLLLK